MKMIYSLLLLAFLATNAQAADLLIRNARVHSDTGVMAGYDVLVSGERIAAIGNNIAAPENTVVIEAEGRSLTPALFAGITALGLVDVGAVSSSSDAALSNDSDILRPEFDVSLAYNPNSAVIPVVRVEGFGFTLLAAAPNSSLIGGLGRAVFLDGGYRSFSDMPVLFVGVGGSYAASTGGSRAAQWMLLEQMMAEVASVPKNDSLLLTRAGRQMLKKVQRQGKVVFQVERAADILRVLDFAARHKLDAVIAGASEAWMVAEELAQANVPVVLNPLDNLPASFDTLGARLDNAALLDKAGVTVVFSGSGTHHARKQRQMAGNAVANGMPHAAALAALTVNPATVFGIDTGVLKKGARADMVLWSGDPLEVNALADRVILNGELDSMESRQTKLRDRYLTPADDMPRAYRKP